jgi:hypothetical protein
MRFARGFIGAYRLCVAGGGELSEKNGAIGRPFNALPRTTALSCIALAAFILSCAWSVNAVASRSAGGKWAQAEQEAAHQAIPDDYVEGSLTLVLHRDGL